MRSDAESAGARNRKDQLKLRSKGASIQNRLSGASAALSPVHPDAFHLSSLPALSPFPSSLSSRSLVAFQRTFRSLTQSTPSASNSLEMFSAAILFLAAAVSPALATVYVRLFCRLHCSMTMY